jgi:hypothetical protein
MRQFGFVDDHRGAATCEYFGVSHLVVHCWRIGNQDCRHAGQRQFGQCGSGRSTHDQVRFEHDGRHLVDVRDDERVNANFAIPVSRVLQLAIARLMDDLPSGQAIA